MLLLGLVALLMLVPGLRNWLVVLFMMNAGLSAHLPHDPLRAINAIDIVTLALVGVSFLGLWPILGRQHRFWTAIGIAQPFLGIPVLLATGSQGRSGVMGGGLVISILMLLTLKRGRLLAWVGIVANALLLAGDFGTGIVAGGLLAPAIGVGYLLLFVWYLLLAASLMTAAPEGEGRFGRFSSAGG